MKINFIVPLILTGRIFLFLFKFKLISFLSELVNNVK